MVTVRVERDRERSRTAALLELLEAVRASLAEGKTDPAFLANYRALLEPWLAEVGSLEADPEDQRARARAELEQLLLMFMDRSAETGEAADRALHEAAKLKARLREAASS